MSQIEDSTHKEHVVWNVRTYNVKHGMYIWHIDSHHKLIH